MGITHLIVVCAACMAAYSACLNTALGAEYTATGWLRVSSREPVILARAEREFSGKEFEIYKNTQRLLLKSRFVLMAALRKPEVATIPDVKTAMREGDAVRWLDKQIKVEFPDDAEIMSVSCTRNDPDEAQTLLKAVVDAYKMEIVIAEQDVRRERFSELERLCMVYGMKLRKAKEMYIQLTPDIPDGNEKAKPFRPSVDIQMLQLEMKIFEKEIIQLHMEMHRQKTELRARPRVVQLGPIEKPLMLD